MLMYLAVRGDEPASVETIARAYGISANHLAKVAQHLVRLGWVTSSRGRGGGLSLNATAWEVPLGAMLKRLEVRWDLVECFGSESRCPVEPACGLKSVLHEAQQAFFSALDRYTLRDVVTDRNRLVSLLRP
jgi:Rrf2 family nitric oxide-sensitive transcriptional repressor